MKTSANSASRLGYLLIITLLFIPIATAIPSTTPTDYSNYADFINKTLGAINTVPQRSLTHPNTVLWSSELGGNPPATYTEKNGRPALSATNGFAGFKAVNITSINTLKFSANLSGASVRIAVAPELSTEGGGVRLSIETAELMYFNGAAWVSLSEGAFNPIFNQLYEFIIEIDDDNNNFSMYIDGSLKCKSCAFQSTGPARTLLLNIPAAEHMTLFNMSWWNGSRMAEPQSTAVPTVTLNSPRSGDINNTAVNFTFSVTNSAVDSCTLYGNWTGTFASNATLSTLAIGTYNFGLISFPDGDYLWNVKCLIGSTEYWASNVTFTIDSTYPTITMNANNEWKATNYSNNNQYDNSLIFNITFAEDRDLDGIFINISKGGIDYFVHTNTSLSGLSYTYYNTTSVANWQAGVYNIIVQVADSHTNNKIEDYGVIKSPNKVKFLTAEGNDIEVYSDDDSIASTEKKEDRYEFGFNFVDGLTAQRTFNIKSKNTIKYKANSGYVGHFIVYGDNGQGNWIDFEGVGGNPVVTKVNDKNYRITFNSVPANVKFKSIGGLNVLTQNYKWYRGVYNSSSRNNLVGETGTFNFNATTSTSITDIGAVLIYNGTDQGSSTETSDASYYYFVDTATNYNAGGNVLYFWNVTITQGDASTYSFLTNNTQSLTNWGISNCTTGEFAGNVVLLLKFYEEDTPANSLVNTVEVNAQTYALSPTNYKNFTFYGVSNHTYTLCMSNGTQYADIYIKYKNESYTHRYYLYNTTLTSTGYTTLNLYNTIATTGRSIVNIVTRYSDSYNFFSNVVVQMQRFYTAENVWRTVQMDKSGDFGLVSFDILEHSADYRFIFLDTQNHVLSQTNTITFSCTSNLCEQTKLLSAYSASATTAKPAVSVTYNNNTGIVTTTWSDSSLIDITSLVTLETGKGTSTICNNHTAGSATGTMKCYVGAYDGTIFVNVNTTKSGVQSTVLGRYFKLASTTLSTFIGKRDGAFFSFMIMLPIIGFSLYSPVAAVMAGSVSLVIIYFLGIFTAINLSFIVVAIIIALALAYKMET